MNERLRAALRQRGLSVEQLARTCGVDPKTASRWVTTASRTPHPRQRRAAAELLGTSERYLWPALTEREPFLGSIDSQAELVGTYPDRASVPRDVWLQLVNGATSSIDILVFSGTFLAQTNPKLPQILMDSAANGAQVRLCFGDPDGSAVALRDEEEGINGALGAKIRACLSYFPRLVGSQNCGIRLHNHTLYASIFRYDDQAMINPHIWGSPASANPLFHFRRLGEDCTFGKYMNSFERIWEQSKPWYPKS
jgi:transcriptional regulator with XRE-family HTH domain